jgi:hypothetical protein
MVIVRARRTMNARPSARQRTGQDGQCADDGEGERAVDHQLGLRDREQVAEQHRGGRARVRAGQRGEQDAQCRGQGEDRAGRHLAVGHPPAEQSDEQAAADAEDGQPQRDRNAEQDRSGGARKPDVGEGVRGERVLPGDHEVAEQAGGDGDQRASDQRVLQERALQDLQPVRLELHAGEGLHRGSRQAARVNRSPCAVRTTPTGVP